MQKVSKASVNYRDNDKRSKRCGNCDMYSLFTCTLVKGIIEPGKVCDKWVPEKPSS